MAIGREILLLHGGSVRIIPKSEFAVGNTISIFIPFQTVNIFSPISSPMGIDPFRKRSVSSLTLQAYTSSFDTSVPGSVQGNPAHDDEVETSKKDKLIDSHVKTSSVATAKVIATHVMTSNMGSPTSNNLNISQNVSDIPSYNLTSDAAALFTERMKCLHTMVVDDTPSNRKMLQHLLTNNKVSSDIACDGVEAIEQFNNNSKKYELIFMDYTMPNMVNLVLIV